MVECPRCGNNFTPSSDAAILEGLCPSCIFDPERTEGCYGEAMLESAGESTGFR